MLDVLEAIARNESLPDVLAAICLASDAGGHKGSQATSILLYDPELAVLNLGAAPRLPAPYRAASMGIPIGPVAGSCGTAVWRRQPVIVRDIATDPLWADYREIALAHGLRSCWSIPVFGTDGDVLASFAIYHAEPYTPSEDEIVHHRRLSHLVSIAIERCRDAERLRSSEQRLQFALEGANDAMWDWNIRTGETFLSPRWETMLGYEPGEVPRHVSAWEALLHPVDRARVTRALEDHLCGRTGMYETEHRMRRKDGSWCWVLDRGKVVERAPDGTPLRAVGTHSDISARKRIEFELVEARQRAEQASRVKTEFLACMSHELRTPLNAIIGFSELLTLGIAGNLSPRQAGYVRDIHGSGQLLLDIVSDLLDFSRIEAGKLELRPEPTSLRLVVGASLGLLRARARKGGVNLRASVPRDLPCILADPSRLKQVTINLVSNAIKFTPAGGRVTVTGHQDRRDIVLSVRDTGIGMTAAEIELAQQPFTQVEQRFNRRHEGVGLGLSIAKSLVEMHHGQLTVDSEKGAGTTVTVRLPLCAGPCRAVSVQRPTTCVIPEPLAFPVGA